MNATATFTVGVLIRKRVRQELEKLKFQGMEFEWMELKHFLDRDFTLKGEVHLVNGIVQALVDWVGGD